MKAMEWLSYVIAAVFLALGAGCVALIIFSLPGVWMMLGLAAIIEFCDRWYLPPERDQTFGWWVLGVSVGLAAIAEVIDFAAGAEGARRGGASKRGMIGALIGGIAGVFLFTPLFFFVPVIGALLGAILGTFVGAVIGELTAPAATMGGTVKPALGATIGRVVGTVSKIGIAIAIWLALSVAAFWP
jgi:uncharacterized protein YqgC (DUF456 family)